MKTWGTLVVLGMVSALFLFVSCSGTQVKEEPVPPRVEDPVPEPVPEPAVTDPYQQKLARFEAAYRELACRANIDFDPESSFATIREPYAEIVRMTKEKSKSIESYLVILQKHGYGSAQELFDDRERIDVADPNWFKNLTGGLYDMLDACE
ncbi:MAG: hypothetical protein FJ109_19865 [Deltaproteobacteria bacterium]|nr:hypothetical protein [Deltaproteobacteria bacterium]